MPIHVEDLHKIRDKVKDYSHMYNIVLRLGSEAKGLKNIVKLERELSKVNNILHKASGYRLWSAQKAWARRVLLGKSFAIIAPTGVGKTVFGIIMSLYNASKGRKSYIILPTTPLVIQVTEKLLNYTTRAKLDDVKIINYHSKLSKSERQKAIKAIEEGEFDILVTTSKFLALRFDILRGKKFDFIFVDDVDSILKSSKNIDRVLMLMGFTEDEITRAYEFIKTKIRLARLASIKSPKLSEELEEFRKLKAEVSRSARRRGSVLVVSSATGRPRGLRVKLFRELLGFEIGSRSEILRNIIDTFIEPVESIENTVYNLVSLLGGGGLVFVPVDRGLEYATKLVEYLRNNGVKAEVFSSKNVKVLNEFIKGDIEVLLGVATYYGVMVRGIDLPEVVRYAVFTGVPRFKFSTRFENPHPANILRALSIIRSALEGEERRRIELIERRIRRALKIMAISAISKLAEKLRAGEEPLTAVEKLFYDALNIVKEKLRDPELRRRMAELPDVIIREEKDGTFIYIPDVMTYIQASGRTSRMYAGGITLGLSVVIVDDKRLFEGLKRRMSWMVEDAEWKNFKELNMQETLNKINEEREKVKKILKGELKGETVDLVKTALLIVESPSKARTISNFFGKPSVRRYDGFSVYETSLGNLILMITASGGHVYDLVTDEGYHGVRILEIGKMKRFLPVYTAIRRCAKCGYQFSDDLTSCPRCGSKELKSSLDTIEFLRKLAIEADMVLIGTDPDTEGEKIGWDIAALLAPYNPNVTRIEFHEVTKRAITEALRSPRNFNTNLVEAQIVRRVEDRWIGFELSKRLWRAFNKHWLSAGRVQTPVLGWIIDRYRQWSNSLQKIFRIEIENGLVVEFSEKDAPPEVSMNILQGKPLTVAIREVKTWEEELSPLPPYTTDSLLFDASLRLHLSAQEAMSIAQDLFEMGFITYHRTDSTRVSPSGIGLAIEYLKEKFGEQWKQLYYPRKWGTGGAHECIRPTRPLDVERLREVIVEDVITPVKRLTGKHFKLYDMIFRRFIASQMVKAVVRKQSLQIIVDGYIKDLERVVEVVEPGFLTENPILTVEDRVKPGEYKVRDIRVLQRHTIPLFTQGDIIKIMKEKGIGRPSTYAKILQTLFQRKYVIETKKGKRLVPTELGIRVYRYLTRNYGNLVSEERTALLERIMDEIELGNKNYQRVLDELFQEIYLLP